MAAREQEGRIAMRIGWIGVASLVALAACGRGGGEAERQAAAGNATVRVTPADITVSTTNGNVEIHAGGALAGLPEGIPPYPNADAGQNLDINSGSAPGQGRILGFSTHDAPAQVIDFYARAIGAAGYTIANRMDMGASATLTARRGQGQAVNIVATQAGAAGTRVQIIVAAEAG
jgi:hypothetical protein